MNPDEMLDYALGQLDAPAREAFQRAMADDPVAAERAERLTRAVWSLVDDEDDEAYAPPPGLAERTIAFVGEPRARRRTILDFVPASVPFRWGDVAVAASIFFAALLTLVPPASRARDRMAQLGCTYNLQQLGISLWNYGSKHHHYPSAVDPGPDAHVGSYLACLSEDGLLPDLKVLDCPCNSHDHQHPPVPRLRELAGLRERDPELYSQTIRSDYAYNISLRHCGGGVEDIMARHGTVPLLADRPALDVDALVQPGNSPNHHGLGQNVLYSDLHVGFHPTRRLGPDDPDMFLNRAGRLEPGDDETDAVLTHSLIPFRGARVVPVGR